MNKNVTLQIVPGEYITNCTRARQLELAGEWEQALKFRKYLGHTEDVQAIESIIESTRLGDRYRELTKQAFEDYENRLLNIYEFTAKLTEAHNEVYGRPY